MLSSLPKEHTGVPLTEGGGMILRRQNQPMSTRVETLITVGGDDKGHVRRTAACLLFYSTRAGCFLCLSLTKFRGLDFGSCHEDQDPPAPSRYLAVPVGASVIFPPSPKFIGHPQRCMLDAPSIAGLMVRKQR